MNWHSTSIIHPISVADAMNLIEKIINKLPMPSSFRYEWRRSITEKGYALDIADAKSKRDNESLQSLTFRRMLEIEFIDESEDQQLTRKLVARAKKMKIPIPHRHDSEGNESIYWYQAQQIGGWALTSEGYAKLREDIRAEIRSAHDTRGKWIVMYVSPLTGLVGAICALVALLSKFH